MNLFLIRAQRRARVVRAPFVAMGALMAGFSTTARAAPGDAKQPDAATQSQNESSSSGTAENRTAAEPPSPSPYAEPQPGAVPPSPGKRPENGYWSVGEPRWFVSTKSDIGTPYIKPYFSAGYGIPHWIWAGVDVNSISTGEFAQVYAGVRATSPVLDLAFGFRDTWSFGKPFLAPKASFTRSDVVDAPGSTGRYWAWEAEAVGIVPLPHAAIVADFILVKTLDVPQGMYVYEESYRAVVAKPLYAIFRTAVVARILREGSLRVGPLVEYVFATGREQNVVRVGPAVSFQLTDHLEVQGALTLAVSSPDRLGLTLGAYGVAGLRYRWATGERSPKLPWRGELTF
jgi:hypothetical protein